MGGKVGPVRRRRLGKSGPARRFYLPESRDPEEPLSAMIKGRRRADEAERVQLAEERAAAAEHRRSG